jgi:hypothetical protein
MPETKSETQTYKVIKTAKDFEIRFYPSVTMAMIVSSANTYKDLGRLGFRKLAGYIFGANRENKKFPMITPVHMAINDAPATMSFVMPGDVKPEHLPPPNDRDVIIKTNPEEYVAALKFGGFATDHRIKEHAQKLEDLLKLNAIDYNGSFRFLGYDAPYHLFNRRNEIIVSVNWQGK